MWAVHSILPAEITTRAMCVTSLTPDAALLSCAKSGKSGKMATPNAKNSEKLRVTKGDHIMEDTPQGPNDNVPPPAPPPAEPPPPPPQETPPVDIVSDNRTIMIVLSYLGLLALIPLLVEKDDKEVQWHAKHGLVLAVVEVAVMIGLMIIGGVLGAVSGGLGCIIGLLWPVFLLVILVVHVLCIVKGLNGQRFLIPGISEYADRF